MILNGHFVEKVLDLFQNVEFVETFIIEWLPKLDLEIAVDVTKYEINEWVIRKLFICFV